MTTDKTPSEGISEMGSHIIAKLRGGVPYADLRADLDAFLSELRASRTETLRTLTETALDTRLPLLVRADFAYMAVEKAAGAGFFEEVSPLGRIDVPAEVSLRVIDALDEATPGPEVLRWLWKLSQHPSPVVQEEVSDTLHDFLGGGLDIAISVDLDTGFLAATSPSGDRYNVLFLAKPTGEPVPVAFFVRPLSSSGEGGQVARLVGTGTYDGDLHLTDTRHPPPDDLLDFLRNLLAFPVVVAHFSGRYPPPPAAERP